MRGHKTQIPDSSIKGRQCTNRQLQCALSVGSCQMDGVSEVSDQVLNGVSDEVPDGGSDRDFSLLQENHTLDLHKHQTEMN
jgi:hypothetical protein